MQCADCSNTLGDAFYSAAPLGDGQVGDLCIGCHVKRFPTKGTSTFDSPVRDSEDSYRALHFIWNRLDAKRNSSDVLTVAERHVLAAAELALEGNWPQDCKCKRGGCDNRARYDSGYCGVCDIVKNGGNGTRR